MLAECNFTAIEPKWLDRWEKTGIFKTPDDPREKFYVLEMFPYPSGDIHMGHFRNYAIGDVVARFEMMRGRDVLHPMGYDGFGLPAESAAIKNGTHPRNWTFDNIATMGTSLRRMGLTYDWNREVVTCDPAYYKHTQALFLLLFKRGLAYQAPAYVHWCDSCQTTLANEQAKEGTCWRCKGLVCKRKLENCWFFKYSEYAQRLLDDINRLDEWPEGIKIQQRDWIGRSEGCEIDFRLENGERFSVFTTRPDTLSGVTFIVIAPEHPLVELLSKGGPQEKLVESYIQAALLKRDFERTAEGEKDGIFTGQHATHPLTGERIPIFVAEYVLGSYGTGVVMGVPAHDTRDFAFAKKYSLPIKVVISGGPAEYDDAYTGNGLMIDSGELTGTPSPDGIPRVIEYLTQKGVGRTKVNYKLKDWLISRQRFWGAPVPIIHCPACGTQPVPDAELPVLLPEGEVDLLPRARSPLAGRPEFVATTCPKCNGPAQRDPDTMDTFMCSSFYLFRYTDPHNPDEPWRPEEAAKWLPVDIYIGGAEHACMHLLYFRFITKVLYDAGFLSVDEPVRRLFNQGMVKDANGDVMSKSKGNVVSPVAVFDEWGVDVARLAMLSFAASHDDINWKEDGLIGARRLVRKLSDAVRSSDGQPVELALVRQTHQLIAKVTRTMERDLAFNTAIAGIWEFLNSNKCLPRDVAEVLVKLVAPMAPFLAEELWELLGHSESVFQSEWPQFNENLAIDEEVQIVIQVDGKVRGRFDAPASISENDMRERALSHLAIKKHLGNRNPQSIVVVKGRLVNIIL